MRFKQRYLIRLLQISMGVTFVSAPLAAAMAAEETPPVKNEGDSLPLTKAVVSRGSLDKDDPQDGYEAVKNVAGVTNASAKGTISDNFNVRGIQLDTYSSYRLNGGVPLANIIAIPSSNKERIEVLKGANALMFGIASPAGIVNLVTKRATEKDVTTVGVSGNSFGGFEANLDFGRKFGANKQFGVRINLAGSHLESGVEGTGGHGKFGSIAFDWKATDRLSFKFDHENYSRNVVEQSQLQIIKPVNGVIAVPNVPDPTKLLSGSWALYQPKIENTQLRTDFLVNDAWKAIAEVGHSDGVRSRFISRINNYNVTTGWGTSNINLVNNQHYINSYWKTELIGKFSWYQTKHTLTMGVMTAERNVNTPSVKTVTMAQNIYDPIVLAAPIQPTLTTYTPSVAKNTGVYAYDMIGVGQNMTLLIGQRQTKYDADNTLANGTNKVTSSTKGSPAIGAVYNILPNTALYGSFMKGLEETGTAPAGTTNQFAFLPPAEATQKEFGIRTALRTSFLRSLTASAAIFNIERANAVTDVASNTYLLDGTTDFTGLEATASADFNSQWLMNVGGQLMKAKQNPIFDMTIKGLTPENTPKLSGNLSLTHRPAIVPGLSLTAGTSYVGKRFINPQNQATIPEVFTFNAGAGYATIAFGRKTSFQFNIDNLTDKRYFNSAAGGQYGVGMTRSFKVSAKMDF